MATAISYRQVESVSPAVYMQTDYDYYRSGNNMYYTMYVRMRIESTVGWRNNRWACRIWFDDNLVVSNGTVKPQTSGALGTAFRTYTSPQQSKAINSGSVGITVHVIDTGYSTSWNVNDDWGQYGGSLAVTSPSAPSTPSSCNIPGSVAPDKVANISWGASSGGTNGVSGYALAYSRNGGSSYDYIDVGNTTSYNLNLNTSGFVQGSVLKCSVQSYTTVNGVKFYSDWRYSGSTTTSFVAPSSPKTTQINVIGGGEAIPTATIRGQWAVPDSGGTNGVSGYAIQWLKNGSNYGAEIDIGNVLNRNITLNGTDYQPGDVISYKVRAYTTGQGSKYYSGYVTDGSITIISDKYIWVSDNGGAFIKRKAFISINGGSFGEMKKEKLHII